MIFRILKSQKNQIQSDIQSDNKNVTLEEQKIIDLIIDNPNITQNELAKALNVRTEQ